MARLRIVVAALAGAAFLLAGFAAGAAPLRVALLPIVVHSAGSDTDYLSRGLADMLTARLERSGGFVVVRPAPAKSGTPGEDGTKHALEAGRALDADYVVFGSFTQFGSGASLDVRCMPLRGKDDTAPRRVFVQAGALGDIIPKLDDLSDRIARYMAGDAGVETTAATAAGGTTSGGTDPLEELRNRVEALERAVFVGGADHASQPPPVAGAQPPPATESEVR